MSSQFQCKMCGNCCRKMRGRTAERCGDRYIGRHVFMAVPPSQTTMALFEWEVSTLKEKGDQLSVQFKTKPTAIFWNETNQTPIATQWNLDHDNCPFLSNDNLCKVHRQKPLVCQAYPLLSFGVLSDGQARAPIEVEIGDCPNAVPLPFPKGRPLKLKTSTVFREFFKVYGKTFLGMLRLNGAIESERILLKTLEKEGLIRPAILNKTTLKALLRKKPIGLHEYLQDKHPEIEQEFTKDIESIYQFSFTDLKQIIKKN